MNWRGITQGRLTTGLLAALLLATSIMILLAMSTVVSADATIETTCWWEYRGTFGGQELWCYVCCNHPDLPPGCHDLFCEWR